MLAATALNRIILKIVLCPTQEGDEDTTESEHRDDDFEDSSEEVDELKLIPSPASSSDDDSDQESFTEYIKRSQDVLTSSSDVPTSFDVTNAMASCGTSDSALSEMDSSSITMPDVISGEDVFKEVQQLSGMTDAWILKCEDLRYSPSHTEIQSKLTARKKNFNLTGHPGSGFSTWIWFIFSKCIVMLNEQDNGRNSYIYWKVCNHI